MKGYSVCWMPGTDHAGIATQNVVERMLASENRSREELGRENFIKEVTYLSQTCHYDDPIDRLTCYANEGGIIIYGVIRTESKKALWDL